ncbi:MAG: hypothetical protein ACRDTD_25265 [Pseudonocardiaceae bacterium]
MSEDPGASGAISAYNDAVLAELRGIRELLAAKTGKDDDGAAQLRAAELQEIRGLVGPYLGASRVAQLSDDRLPTVRIFDDVGHGTNSPDNPASGSSL